MQPAAHPLLRRQASSHPLPGARKQPQAASTADIMQRAAHGLDLSARPLLLSQKPLSQVANGPQPLYRCCSLIGRLPQVHTCDTPHTTAAAKAVSVCIGTRDAALILLLLPPAASTCRCAHALQGLSCSHLRPRHTQPQPCARLAQRHCAADAVLLQQRGSSVSRPPALLQPALTQRRGMAPGCSASNPGCCAETLRSSLS